MGKKKASDAVGSPKGETCPIQFYEELFVFNRVSGMFYLVSGEAAFILRAVWEGRSRDEIKDMMIARFQIERSTAIRDTEQFMAKLKDMDLLPASGKA